MRTDQQIVDALFDAAARVIPAGLGLTEPANTPEARYRTTMFSTFDPDHRSDLYIPLGDLILRSPDWIEGRITERIEGMADAIREFGESKPKHSIQLELPQGVNLRGLRLINGLWLRMVNHYDIQRDRFLTRFDAAIIQPVTVTTHALVG